jgi:hypothetical protein
MNLNKKPLVLNALCLTFAALTFEQLDEHKADVDLLMTPAGANFSDPVAREALLNVALASLSGPHPEITEKDLKKNLDTFNFPDVVAAIFLRNGFIGDAPKEGEAKAAASST